MRSRLTALQKRSEQGFVLVLMAISLTTLLLIAGFGVDVGAWYLRASHVQRASDAAALSAAQSLPDVDQAKADAALTLARNGITHGVDGIEVAIDGSASKLTVSVTDRKVPTYFLSSVMENITITRSSSARRGTDTPSLGSPYNVLGSGDLSLSGLPEPQNFWLAINGMCAPKEDGDFYNARWDANKIGVDPNTGLALNSSARHNCPNDGYNGGNELNHDFTGAGYSYFIDIPPPPSNGSVTLSIYDMNWNTPGPGIPDEDLDLPNDSNPWVDMSYQIYDTKGTPETTNDDVLMQAVNTTSPYDSRSNMMKAWKDIYTFPYASIKDGALYRLQVQGMSDDHWMEHLYGINAFSVMAKRSWTATEVCDSRVDAQCPRVYGRTAISVLSRYAATGGTASGTSTAYFARVPGSFAGSTINAYLWDPGEGVDKIEMLGPDGQPLKFDWEVSPTLAGYSGTNVDFLDTSGTGTQPGPNRSSNKKFNDRLVVLHVHLPDDYYEIASDSNDYLSIRYTLTNSPNDRTTWGIGLPGGSGTPAKLVRRP